MAHDRRPGVIVRTLRQPLVCCQQATTTLWCVIGRDGACGGAPQNRGGTLRRRATSPGGTAGPVSGHTRTHGCRIALRFSVAWLTTAWEHRSATCHEAAGGPGHQRPEGAPWRAMPVGCNGACSPARSRRRRPGARCITAPRPRFGAQTPAAAQSAQAAVCATARWRMRCHIRRPLRRRCCVEHRRRAGLAAGMLRASGAPPR